MNVRMHWSKYNFDVFLIGRLQSFFTGQNQCAAKR